jgi:hypothetical protein
VRTSGRPEVFLIGMPLRGMRRITISAYLLLFDRSVSIFKAWWIKQLYYSLCRQSLMKFEKEGCLSGLKAVLLLILIYSEET